MTYADIHELAAGIEAADEAQLHELEDAELDAYTTNSNGTEPATEWQPLTVSTFLELPEPAGAELLGPLVLRGGRTIIGGDSGHGKTTLAFAITAAILNGTELLGQGGAGEGPALIIDLEQGIKSIKRGIREAELGDTDSHILNLPDGLALDQDVCQLSELENVIAALRPVVVVLDPYYKAHRGDANEERGVTDLMRNLDRLRTDYGFALILPAHVRKEQQTGGPRKLSLADIAGSGAISRGAEIVLAIERLSHGEARLRYLKDREGDLPIGDHLDLTYTKTDGFQVKERETSLSIEQRILAVSDSGWLIAAEWARELELNDQETRSVLKRLAAADKISCETGPPGRKHNAVCYSTSARLTIPADHSRPSRAEWDATCSAALPASSIGRADRAEQHTPDPAAQPSWQSNDDIPF
jgi:hypothetical protein